MEVHEHFMQASREALKENGNDVPLFKLNDRQKRRELQRANPDETEGLVELPAAANE